MSVKIKRVGPDKFDVEVTSTLKGLTLTEAMKYVSPDEVHFADARGSKPSNPTKASSEAAAASRAPKATQEPKTLTNEQTASGKAFIDAVREAGAEGISLKALATKFEMSDARKLRGHWLAAEAMEPKLSKSKNKAGETVYTLA